LSKVR